MDESVEAVGQGDGTATVGLNVSASCISSPDTGKGLKAVGRECREFTLGEHVGSPRKEEANIQSWSKLILGGAVWPVDNPAEPKVAVRC